MQADVCSLSSDLLSGHAVGCVCVPCLATCSRVMQAGVCVLSSDLLSGHAGRCVSSLSSDLLSGHTGGCVCVLIYSMLYYLLCFVITEVIVMRYFNFFYSNKEDLEIVFEKKESEFVL